MVEFWRDLDSSILKQKLLGFWDNILWNSQHDFAGLGKRCRYGELRNNWAQFNSKSGHNCDWWFLLIPSLSHRQDYRDRTDWWTSPVARPQTSHNNNQITQWRGDTHRHRCPLHLYETKYLRYYIVCSTIGAILLQMIRGSGVTRW